MTKRVQKPLDWPRYMQVKKLAGGRVAYYWNLPTWAVRAGCPIPRIALGGSYGPAKKLAEEQNALFKIWQLDRRLNLDQIQLAHERVANRGGRGTVGWMFDEFTKTHDYRRLSRKTKLGYDSSMAILRAHRLPNGTHLEDAQVSKMTPGDADKVFERVAYRIEGELGEPGEPRFSTASACIRVFKRAWNVVHRRHHLLVPKENPFVGVRTKQTGVEVFPATFTDVKNFAEAANKLNQPALAAAAWIAFEWLQRESSIIERLRWDHYEPGRRVLIVHQKTRKEVWLTLTDESGEPLYPELERQLALTPKRGDLIVMRDWLDRKAGDYLPHDAYSINHRFNQIAREASLDPRLSFRSFRKGGFTEAGDAESTDTEMMATGAHMSRETLSIYTARTNRQAANLARKRRNVRMKG